MHIVHFLKETEQWQSHRLIWCHFVCMICVVDISVDGSIVVLTIAKYVACCDHVIVEIVVIACIFDFNLICIWLHF